MQVAVVHEFEKPLVIGDPCEIRPLDTVNASIDDVLGGRVEARIVFDPALVPAR